jgi:hypothetical protein
MSNISNICPNTTDFYIHHLESVERKMANVLDNIIGENNEEKEEENIINNSTVSR